MSCEAECQHSPRCSEFAPLQSLCVCPRRPGDRPSRFPRLPLARPPAAPTPTRLPRPPRCPAPAHALAPSPAAPSPRRQASPPSLPRLCPRTRTRARSVLPRPRAPAHPPGSPVPPCPRPRPALPAPPRVPMPPRPPAPRAHGRDLVNALAPCVRGPKAASSGRAIHDALIDSKDGASRASARRPHSPLTCIDWAPSRYMSFVFVAENPCACQASI